MTEPDHPEGVFDRIARKAREAGEREDGLEDNYADRTASLLRIVFGPAGPLAPFLSEMFTSWIPNQRADRLREFVRVLAGQSQELMAKFDTFEVRVKTLEGAMLFEEVMTMGARTISETKREFLATLLTRALTDEQVDLSQSRRVAEVLVSLDEGDLIWLTFYSVQKGITREGAVGELMDLYPAILNPVGRTMSTSDEENDREAMQESYKGRLQSLGLVVSKDRGGGMKLTGLGRLVIRLALPDEEPSSG